MPLKSGIAHSRQEPPGMVGRWIQAFRLHFVPTSLLPAVLGSIVAWSRFDRFDGWSFALVIIGMGTHHIGLNMIDDVFDFLHAVDRTHGEEKNPYTGGSGVLTGKLLPVHQVLAASIGCYLIAIGIAVYLTLQAGWPVFAFTAFGVFSSIFYTMPPIRYGYRGFGELGLLVNFGPVISLGAFYVQTGMIAWEPFVISLVPGFLMWSMIVINEIPDYDEDRIAGKLNLVARHGRRPGVFLYVAGLLCAYLVMIMSVAFGWTSAGVLLGLLTVPIAYRAYRTLDEHYMDKMKMAPANLDTIKVHALTLAGLIAGYIFAGVM